MMSLALAVVMCMTLSVPAFAEEFAAKEYGYTAESLESNAVPVASGSEAANTIKEDMRCLSAFGIPVDKLKASGMENGRMSYTYQITDEVVAHYTIEKGTQGTLILNVTEGKLHNVIQRKPDGTLYIDGEKAFTPSNVSLRMHNADYSSSPYGSRSDYTTYVGMTQNSNVPLSKAITEMTISALCSLIASYMGLPGPFSDLLSDAIMYMVNDAQSHNPGSRSVSYKEYIYNSNKSIGGDMYRQHNVYCYSQTNYAGNSNRGTFYEHSYFS
jgi:hypothetical protein